MRPLLILVADKQMEEGLKAFFSSKGADGRPRLWHFKLGCASFEFDPEQDILRDPASHDCEVYQDGAELLRAQRGSYARALVILDQQFPGSPGAENIRAEMLTSLHASGWPADSVDVVVIQPCLEAWLWSDDVHVEAAFGHTRPPSLRSVMEAEGYWPAGAAKPAPNGTGADLKAATAFALHRGQQKLHSLTFRKVFGSPRNISLCVEPGFQQMSATLQRWFP
ncbi:hypothetical protein Ga0100231_016590 [Opitutaceae bacterium TAV4]|nr:hypothetical protein Ga0100231_016590 [Opitutaceae bacterium TAV4]RRK02166.1 hypothetical protein Ga0100230_002905 [Opitutaceae bacterium TAV3]